MTWNIAGGVLVVFGVLFCAFANLSFIFSLVRSDKSMRKTAYKAWGYGIGALCIGFIIIEFLGTPSISPESAREMQDVLESIKQEK